MWITEAEDEILRTWIKHCPVGKLVSTADERILYANDAFLEWIGYTLSELQSIGWRRISVESDSLSADLKAVSDMADGYMQTYRVQKQYIPKNSKPEWGVLTVMRYPAAGEVKCFLCTWEPLKNGTQAAFTLAMEKITTMTTTLDGVRSEVKNLTTMDEDATLVNAVIRFVKRQPKIAGGFLAMALSIFGLNNVVELLQRVGIVEIPVKTPVPVQPVSGEVPTANLISDPSASSWTLTTANGHTIEVNKPHDLEAVKWHANRN